MKPSWIFSDEMTMIAAVAMKGKGTIIPEELQQQAIEQLHMNHTGIKKTRLLAGVSIQQVNTNNEIENAIKHCTMSWLSAVTT